MRKRRHFILTLLFGLTAVLLFAPSLQQHLELFGFKKLSGYKKPAPKPELTFSAFTKGRFQKQEEEYLKEHFGFREPLIRLYNQWTYDWFKTTSNQDISIGKDGWLFHSESTRQYFGNMEKQFGLSNSQVRDNLIEQARCFAKVNAILKEYGVHLLCFTLPTKSFVYPKQLRKQPFGDTTLNASDFWARQLDSLGVPHINMTPWFKQMQDTIPFDLFYSKGSHWAAGAPIAVDSMLRYMELIGGQSLTHIQLGEPYSLEKIANDDKDLETLLNLAMPLAHEPIFEYPVSLLTDDSTAYPSVWFAGTSFYWYMTRRVNFDALFSFRDMLFYDAVFYTEKEQIQYPGNDWDYLHELLLHDYVVFFRDGPQLYNKSMLFPGKALISLCVSEKRLKEKTTYIADSIMKASDPQTHHDSTLCYTQASLMLKQHPELFEELRGDGIPTARNPRIEQVLTEKAIRNDRNWAFLLTTKAKNDSLDIRKTFSDEAYNVLKNKTLIRNTVYYTTYDYFDFLVEEAILETHRGDKTPEKDSEITELALTLVEQRLRQHAYDDDTLMMMACAMDAFARQLGSETILATIREKAEKKRISIDKAFRDDVVWCLRNNDNVGRFLNEAALDKAFKNYLTERKMRLNTQTMANIMRKHDEQDLPLRVILNRDIDWIQRSREQ